MDAGGGDFLGGGASGFLDLLRIPGGGHAELLREDGGARPEGVAVDAVVADDQRDAQSGLAVDGFDRARQVFGGSVQNRADVLVDDQIVKVAAAGVELHHLADLLLEGHASKQVRDALFGGQFGVLVWQFVGHGILTFFVEAMSFNYQLVV